MAISFITAHNIANAQLIQPPAIVPQPSNNAPQPSNNVQQPIKLAQQAQQPSGQSPAQGTQNQVPFSQQVVGTSNELLDVGELLGINILSAQSGQAPNYMTLYDTVNALVLNNRKMKADLMSLHSTKLAINKAEAEYLPEVTVSASVISNNSNPENSDSDNNTEGGTWNSYISNRMEVNLSQRLYDFGYREETIKAAEADYQRQVASFRAGLEDKMMELVTLYGELRRAILQYRSVNDYYAQGLELFKVVKDRTDNDLAPQSELEYVQLQLAEARQQLIQVASRVTQGRRAFEQEIGIWPQQLAPMSQVSVERISQFADVNSPARFSASVQEIQAEVARRQADLAVQDAQDMPNLTLEVNGYRNNNASNEEATDYGATGTLQISWKLYDGGRLDLAREQTLVQLKQSKFAVDYLGERAKGDSLRRLIEVKQADSEIGIIRGMIASSDKIIRHNTRLFQAGLVSATFMIGSLRERSFYRMRLVDLEHNRAVSSYGYAYAMGILMAQMGLDIDDIVNNFDIHQDTPEISRFETANNISLINNNSNRN